MYEELVLDATETGIPIIYGVNGAERETIWIGEDSTLESFLCATRVWNDIK